MTVAFGSVWVTGDVKNQLYRIDPKANTITSSIPMSSQPRFLAPGEDSIWVFNQGDGTVQRVDPQAGQGDRNHRDWATGRGWEYRRGRRICLAVDASRDAGGAD